MTNERLAFYMIYCSAVKSTRHTTSVEIKQKIFYCSFTVGIAYVKFSKTSEAAKALEEMNGKFLGDGNSARPIKVLVAAK